MGGGNAQKSKTAREKNLEKNKPSKGSQLDSNKKAMRALVPTKAAKPKGCDGGGGRLGEGCFGGGGSGTEKGFDSKETWQQENMGQNDLANLSSTVMAKLDDMARMVKTMGDQIQEQVKIMIEAQDKRIAAAEARITASHKEILETINKVAFKEVDEKE
uniref:Small EDRK-rich factor-like N-terminal domain-containing protein n=1 Tax=Chenopodium quinoa TaxID=63459 RepID=A0A803KNQ6_CHEQI